MKDKYIFILQIIDKKGKSQNIINIKSKFNKLNDEDKELVLNEMMYWVRQQLNDIQPEQE